MKNLALFGLCMLLSQGCNANEPKLVFSLGTDMATISKEEQFKKCKFTDKRIMSTEKAMSVNAKRFLCSGIDNFQEISLTFYKEKLICIEGKYLKPTAQEAMRMYMDDDHKFYDEKFLPLFNHAKALCADTGPLLNESPLNSGFKDNLGVFRMITSRHHAGKKYRCILMYELRERWEQEKKKSRQWSFMEDTVLADIEGMNSAIESTKQ